MNKTSKSLNDISIDIFLDITDEICPMTFVKTKLLIESMQPGQIAEIRLKGREPIKSVPKSIEEYGHKIISLETEVCNQTNDCLGRIKLKKACKSEDF